MTHETQRIAIAEACGWKSTPQMSVEYDHNGEDYANHYMSEMPDYLNDLNAMREAEHLLFSSKQPLWDVYVQHLYNLGYRGDSAAKYAIHATAAQRAEAFLRALNLWT